MKQIPIGENYFIDEEGNVYSKNQKGLKLRKQNIRGNGYKHVTLTIEPYKSRCYLVHRLMALAYYGESNGMEVRHLDGNKLNNNLSNLMYGTVSENQMDRALHGTSNRGERHGMNILPESTVREIRNKYIYGVYGYKRLAKEFNISPSTIQDIIERKTWKHID